MVTNMDIDTNTNTNTNNDTNANTTAGTNADDAIVLSDSEDDEGSDSENVKVNVNIKVSPIVTKGYSRISKKVLLSSLCIFTDTNVTVLIDGREAEDDETSQEGCSGKLLQPDQEQAI